MALRAQVVFQGASGLSEDRFVNTFHFTGVGTTEEDAGRITARLQQIWQVNLSAPSQPLGDWYSTFVNPTVEVRVYQLADATPRIPVINTFTIAPGDIAGTQALPEEVAVCVSFRAAPPHTQRRRGRVYLGPFCSAVLSAPGSGLGVKVHNGFRNMLVERFQALIDQQDTDGLNWVIRSAGARVPRANTSEPLGALLPETYYTVTEGWIDDAFDTQRRRGPDPAARNTFGP